MFLQTFGEDCRVFKLSAAVGAGTSTINSTLVDTAGYEGVAFLTSLGTAANNNGVKVQDGNASDASDAADLASSKQLSDGTITDFVSDIIRPQKRYHRAVVLRGSSTTIESIWCVLYNPRQIPVTNAGTTQAVKTQISPSDGTA